MKNGIYFVEFSKKIITASDFIYLYEIGGGTLATKTSTTFVALGGGQEVGASSYFLNIDGKNFLFDCGKGVKDNVVFGPNFTTILDPSFLTSLSQIDSVFISHGHFDHVGYLPDFLSQCADAQVFATDLTKELGIYLMMESILREPSRRNKLNYETQCLKAFNRMNTVSYDEKLKFGDYCVTFFEAGHIPGAAMVYLETDTGNVLYTGDFSAKPTPLTGGFVIPEKIQPDTVILCGVHAKHPLYEIPMNGIMRCLNSIKYQLKRSVPVYLTVKQLTKGLEILQIILELVESGEFPEVCIYVDDKLWELSKRFSDIGISVLNENCYRFPKNFYQPKLGMYLGFGHESYHFEYRRQIDFSLHASYSDIKQFIKECSPKNIVVVHSPEDMYSGDRYALQKELPEINFIYANNDEIYLLN